MKTYHLKTDHSERVKAKIFDVGDEDGLKAVYDANFDLKQHKPYVTDLHSQEIAGYYWANYLVITPDHDRTLIETDKFEDKYERI